MKIFIFLPPEWAEIIDLIAEHEHRDRRGQVLALIEEALKQRAAQVQECELASVAHE